MPRQSAKASFSAFHAPSPQVPIDQPRTANRRPERIVNLHAERTANLQADPTLARAVNHMPTLGLAIAVTSSMGLWAMIFSLLV